MRHKVSGRRLERSSSHRRLLYRNLVTDLLDHEKIITTEPKAKEIQAMSEKMITLGKKGGLHNYRAALSFVIEEKVVQKLFSDLATRYTERHGGYTRIIRLGHRPGDDAPKVQIELV